MRWSVFVFSFLWLGCHPNPKTVVDSTQTNVTNIQQENQQISEPKVMVEPPPGAVLEGPLLTREVRSSLFSKITENNPLETKSAAEAWLANIEPEYNEALIAQLKTAIEKTDFTTSRLLFFYGERPNLPQSFWVDEKAVFVMTRITCPGGMAPPRALVLMQIPKTPKEIQSVFVGSRENCPVGIP